MPNPLHLLSQQSPVDKFFLPPSSSNLARDFDWGWNFVLGSTAFFFMIVVVVMCIFIIKYRRRGPNEQTPVITRNIPLEVMWTGIPLALVMAIFFVGFKGFINYDTPQSDCRPVQVVASKWTFDFTYPNGSMDKNLYLEKGIPTLLNITSSDVLHGVYIPAFRTQRNAIFGRTTQIWFIPEQLSPPFINAQNPGGFNLFCTQYCGQGHSKMITHVYVLNKEDYDRKMIELANPFKDAATGKWIPYVKVGQRFFNQSCISCHNVTGAPGSIGPTWKGLWKSKVTFSYSNVLGYTLSPSDSDKKWEAYIRESVLDPGAKIVAGFPNSMPPQPQFSGNTLNDEKFHALLAYIKSVGSLPYTPEFTPEKNPDLFNADAKHPYHPESLAAKGKGGQGEGVTR
ncbi:MAG: cytochrome c oxidase subunit II [Phycisphaerales bacterium]|nr:cytochrome c oxidase subunit II [Phycisphaerales bacterium]